jgi:glucosamine-6-phosphate deaminase
LEKAGAGAGAVIATTPIRVLASPQAIGDDMSGRLLQRIESAHEQGKQFLLGCPTGRTPRPILASMAQRLGNARQDLSHVVLVMMDEYLVDGARGLEYAPSAAPWSCHWFAFNEIAVQLNAQLPRDLQIRERNVWFPDPADAAAYDARIAEAGGIDYFLLASGASDGHVAFNQPGSARDSRTRVVPLSDGTRRDNLRTFPSFGDLNAVPRSGVTVGIATIADAREAAMIVWGTGKRETLKQMRRVDRYNPEWPASVIHECSNREIVCDADAAADLP